MQFFIITASVLLFDQFSKFLVHRFMFVNQSIPIIENILHLTYVQNSGAAFGLFRGKILFLLITGVLVIAAIFYFHERLRFDDHLQTPLALLLGGSLGNMSDRVFRRYVVDFIDFRIWPVFNVADVMINVAVFFIIFIVLKEGK
ncbi:signal peptidase II [candidate division WOR-1 bacterium RIFOXYD2_FULL_36_8]|uniref:Lipoprotein signal peptidase n=1 Tax=candidate division WOR-1 bacterium RIFOXYB2_FULL_36_35 TaxID=1802578 RepID=A0A1F4S2A7_UNCSA|nr:MAG: signal peptidase II [candidate division WOR-1 bacterium RIFOXYA2_FULL_36_21]OGC14574.1 MAG: signal peptidase II [candidate division WOR-1 bacterium RIFOXYB2_FULL_36_35]OGC16246.1 MAG: signal peptidase II [candidate division WOR-1 bacterium RIFOXYA12_FULL_36_13]OGC41805.1 MAG: signal peptidase II [candidate division WOR-1 bacterium RIFOXYD2_FULL_36_8]